MLGFAVPTPGQQLSCPEETVDDPLPKHLLFGWLSSPVQLSRSTWSKTALKLA